MSNFSLYFSAMSERISRIYKLLEDRLTNLSVESLFVDDDVTIDGTLRIHSIVADVDNFRVDWHVLEKTYTTTVITRVDSMVIDGGGLGGLNATSGDFTVLIDGLYGFGFSVLLTGGTTTTMDVLLTADDAPQHFDRKLLTDIIGAETVVFYMAPRYFVKRHCA